MVYPKERVTAAALACFAAKGYSATSIADIEAASGLTPGAVGTCQRRLVAAWAQLYRSAIAAASVA
jgi:hypothetical protein